MKKQILIVDDAKLMRNIIRDIISSSITEYEILEAANGKEALELYKETNPDLVTMDITMDVMDGVVSAKEILKYDPNAKVIIITALGQEKLLNECIDIGVCDYIVKPFEDSRISSAIYKALNLLHP